MGGTSPARARASIGAVVHPAGSPLAGAGDEHQQRATPRAAHRPWATPPPGGSIPTYRVLYAKSEHFRDTLQHPERVTRDNLTDTHVVVALEHAATPDAVFHNMQGEHMTPVLAQRVAQEAGRTSMSVGDALFCVDGSILVCDRAGWIKHDPVEPIYPPLDEEAGDA